MSEYTIWWIDDSEDRAKDADRLSDFAPELSVQFSGPSEAVDRLDEADNLSEVDLVLIDWKLNEHGDFLGKGLTMAGKVSEELPETPLYGFSSEVSELRATATREQFEETYDVSELQSKEGALNIKLDLDSYTEIKNVRGEGLQELIKLLDPPEAAIEDLKSIIPREYTDGLKSDPKINGGSIIEFGEWVRNRFLETPGPLWDDDWTATKIGLQPDALSGYTDELNGTKHGDATYSGIFSHRKSRRWWSTQVIDAVVALAKNRDVRLGELTTVGEVVLGESEKISVCEVCGEDYPDILAAGRDGEDADAPVHLGCSHIHHTREGTFEDYRIADRLK
ncbi:response regulator [Halorubrum cibi]|uniref:CheY chemotaxis protein or a CheY-like REC (Receiver) domain n=1 Tax=Halorubrum cibi TaxID=413815 RepID=A0A521DED1_9EURY|nr:response regulator [Halorubrum cibi]SMO70087.1 CheY chemotaxis protein or a CheY-like REC (receiver) domain [Halorubrum cibi]